MEFAKLYSDLIQGNPRAAFLLSLILCALGLLWTCGVDPVLRDRAAWRSWIGFWAGTTLYYLAATIDPTWDFWIAGMGLYLATASLLVGYHRACRPTHSVLLIVASSAGIVVVAAIFDVLLVYNGHNSGVHQTLTAVAMALWAWHLRRRDEAKSLVILTYALLQLPLQPMLSALSLTSATYALFVSTTFATYAYMKFALIPAVCLAVKMPDKLPGRNDPDIANIPRRRT